MSMENTSGAVLVLLPDEEYMSYRPAVSDAHLTVAYFGKYTDVDPDRAEDYWQSMVTLWRPAIESEITAETWFSTSETEWAHVDLINAPMLPDFRCLAQEMAEVHGLTIERSFGLLPHITRRYISGLRQIEHVHRPFKPKFKLNRMALWVGPSRQTAELE